MAARMTELDPRLIERLRAELAEVLAVSVAYPAFFDYRSNRPATRPIDRLRMDEIHRFLSTVNFSSIERTDITAPDVRRFIERLIVRYVEVNDGLRGRFGARYAPRLRAMAPRLATETQRRAIGYLNGAIPDFGARRQAVSWTSVMRREHPRSSEDRDRATRMLEAALLQRAPAAGDAPTIPTPPRRPSPEPWSNNPEGATVPAPIADYRAMPASARPAPLAEQPTGPLAIPPSSQSQRGDRGRMRELPPDLYQLYGDYLNDMTPEAPAPPPQPRPQPAPLPQPRTPQTPPRDPSGAGPEARNDQLIFWQLRYQLEAYVRRAAQSYGVRHGEGDPAMVLDELRQSGFVDESDLRIAEGIFALTDRVTAQGHATDQEYRQALMLYLLYHRSHLNV